MPPGVGFLASFIDPGVGVLNYFLPGGWGISPPKNCPGSDRPGGGGGGGGVLLGID